MADRRSLVIGIVAAVVVVVLALFAELLAEAHRASRHEAEKRFALQASVPADLTRALFTSSTGQQAKELAKTFGGKTVDQASVELLRRRSGFAYVLVVDAGGNLLASSGDVPPSALRSLDRVDIRRAFAGQAFLSGVRRDARGKAVVEQALPFQTPFGRRARVGAFPMSAIFGFLRTYLAGTRPVASIDSYILDGAARVIASTVPGQAPGDRVTAPLAAALRAGDTGYTNAGSRRVVALAPIGGSSWRVVVTEPESRLYGVISASRSWLAWLVLAAFALAAGVGVLLLTRVLGAAQRLTENAARVRAMNERLELQNVELLQQRTELEAANSELDAFSYSVSHDLRAPLRAIDGFSRILLEETNGTFGGEHRRYLELVRANANDMAQLIDGLLALSALASQPLAVRPVRTDELVREALTSLTPEREGRDVEISVGELPGVDGDPLLLRQVFTNLIGNALKYSRGERHTRIEIAGVEHDGEVVFRVSDNGVGFDMKYADKLFEVFQRLHRAEDYEGTGLGLALVARILKRHGGRIWAESKPGEGATFFFTVGRVAAGERAEHTA
jgi:signal transduction histidine kinase/histone H3/H4